jgi:ABC-type xylose transport system permease subunit
MGVVNAGYLTIPAWWLVGILIGAAQGYWVAYWKHSRLSS